MNFADAMSYHAKARNIPLEFLRAIAVVESNNDPFAIRFERNYRWLWQNSTNKPFRRVSSQQAATAGAPDDFSRPPHKWGWYSSADTEWTGQKTSWGYFQVMGANLRSIGYTKPFTELCCDAELSVRFAATFISKLHTRFYARHGWAGIAAAYNAGRPRYLEGTKIYTNQVYVNRVSKAGAKRFVPYTTVTA